MSIVVQSGFWQDKILADSQRKLTELYLKNPQIANSEKRVILEFWQAYDGLTQVLTDKLLPFISWFYNATSPETITRCLRALKEDGTIKLSPSQKRERQERQEEWRTYWRNHNNRNGGEG